MLGGVCTLLLGLSLGPVPRAVDYFPGDYYLRHGRTAVEWTALDRWPGPTGLLELWRSGTLDSRERIALLLGGGAFHDPQLLPAYEEGLLDPSPKIRMAAAFGLHVLLADGVPDLKSGVDPEAGRKLARIVRGLEEALRSQDLVQAWLQSLLWSEGTTFSNGAVLRFDRPREACASALDQLLQPEDLPLVVEAYRTARTTAVRSTLMRLMSGLGLERFLVRPKGLQKGWGSAIYRQAMDRADAYADRLCVVDVAALYRRRLLTLGARGIAPFDRSSGELWLRVLQKAPAEWWAVAARLVYRNGGPPFFPALSDPESPASKRARKGILDFYGVTHVRKIPLELGGDRAD